MQNNIVVDFSRFPFCFRTVTLDNFTNKLKDANEFFEMFNSLFTKVIPHVSQFKSQDIYTNRHCNILKPERNYEEYNLCLKIVEKLSNEYNNYDFETFKCNHIYDYTMCELGTVNGIRLIGVLYSNIFPVLFIDYYHQIFPSVKYNQKDLLKNVFCPITNYGGKNE